MRLSYRFLRLDLLYVLLAAALIAALFNRKKTAVQTPRDWPIYGLFVVTTLLFAFTTGAANPVSFYRFSSFAFAPMVCVAFYLLAKSKLRHPTFAFILVFACIVVSYSRYEKSDVIGAVKQAAYFASGKISIDDAYSTQFALPADAYAQGVIHPAARAAYNMVGPKVRIWAFTPYNYCLLPDCGVETHISFRMTKRPLDVFFSNATRAKAILRSEGLDYFLITTSLAIRDPLPKTELFSPKNIASHLQMLWTDGDSALLAWPSKKTKPISANWLAKYSKAVGESDYVTTFPLEKMGVMLRAADADKTKMPALVDFH